MLKYSRGLRNNSKEVERNYPLFRDLPVRAHEVHPDVGAGSHILLCGNFARRALAKSGVTLARINAGNGSI